MTEQQAAAYVFSMAVCAQAEIAALQARNASYQDSGTPVGPDEFIAVIEKYGIHHNAVLTTFQNAYRI
jgi:hypothetical protein